MFLFHTLYIYIFTAYFNFILLFYVIILYFYLIFFVCYFVALLIFIFMCFVYCLLLLSQCFPRYFYKYNLLNLPSPSRTAALKRSSSPKCTELPGSTICENSLFPGAFLYKATSVSKFLWDPPVAMVAAVLPCLHKIEL